MNEFSLKINKKYTENRKCNHVTTVTNFFAIIYIDFFIYFYQLTYNCYYIQQIPFIIYI